MAGPDWLNGGPPLDWGREGPRWPHHERSRFIDAAGLRWHVQDWPGPGSEAPAVALLHGTGASLHSWRDVAPRLATRARVLALDLPGHAFTDLPRDYANDPLLSLPGMARGVAALLAALGVQADLLVGHSAGSAIALRLCLDGLAAPRAVVSFNGALLPWSGIAGQLFMPVARWMAQAHAVPRLFAWHASDRRVLQGLLDSTGSRLDAEGQRLYGLLAGNPAHAAGALGMMAQWDLPGLARDLPALRTPLHLVVGERDRTVPPQQAERVRARLGLGVAARIDRLPGLGHLAHEEDPARAAALVLSHLD